MKIMTFYEWRHASIKKVDPLILKSIQCPEPKLVWVSHECIIEKNVTLYPMVHIRGKSGIGENTTIDSGSYVTDSTICANCHVHPHTIVEDSFIDEGCEIGPHAFIQTSSIGKGSHVGFTAQIKRSVLGTHTRAKHHCYIGDTNAGDEVNFGAGSITANYDGIKKRPTVIERGAFIGTNVNLVAPCIIGHDALIAAGTTLRKEKINPHLVIFELRELGKHPKMFQLKTKRGYEHVRLRSEFHALLSKAFGADQNLIYEWLTSPNAKCGNRMPLELLLEGEKECLKSILESITHSCRT